MPVPLTGSASISSRIASVLDFIREGGRVTGVETTQGPIGAGVVGAAVAGHSSVLAKLAGFTLPITSFALQAFVSEPLKPVVDTVVFSPACGTYFSQSDKGGLVIGGGLDRVPSYGQRGNMPMQEQVLAGLIEMSPMLAKVKLLRHWAGIVDVTPDSSPIIGPSGIDGLFVNCGWGTGVSRPFPPVAICSRICWRKANTMKSAVLSTGTVSRRLPDRRKRCFRHCALRTNKSSFFPAPSAASATSGNSTLLVRLETAPGHDG